MVGLLYIMFMAGLELDMNDFLRNKNRSFLFGALTFLLPFCIGFVVCYYLLGYPMAATILVASMFSTHTLVAYPIVSRLGLVRNEAVIITVGGTIITDTAVLLVLAVVAGSANGELNQMFWIKLGSSLAVFSFLVLWGFPKLGRWFFRHVQSENTSQYIFVLVMVFLAALFAELAGVEAIIGAFLAGLALNRLIPHTSPLMNRIEFIGNAIFIPFFLISVGMLVDLRVLFKGPEALIIAGTLTTVALVGKWLAALVTQKVYGYSVHQRRIIFGLSSAHAAATIAVILIGYRIELLDENVLNGTIILILITCMVSSFVTENVGKQIVLTSADINPTQSVRMERLVVPIANPNTIEGLIDLAVMIKEPKSAQPITALTVVQDDVEARHRVETSTRMLEKAVWHGAATNNPVQVVAKVDTNVSSGIIRAIKELMATDVIIGWSEKQKATDRIFGTTLDNILKNSWQSIYVCKLGDTLNTLQHIVVVAPPNVEFEKGFSDWVLKIKRLASQLGTGLKVLGGSGSFGALKERFTQGEPRLEVELEAFDQWEHFIDLNREVDDNSMLVVVSARSGTVSYTDALDNVPTLILKHFHVHSFMVIYPEQNQI
jgi:Kef-type K+ transport system membrane component KefB